MAFEWAAGILVLLGGIFAILGSVGVLRLPDVLIRMHASTKIGTLACGLTMLGVALHFGDLATAVRCGAIMLFLLLTAPIGAHMIGRAALQVGVRLWTPEGTPETDGRNAAPR